MVRCLVVRVHGTIAGINWLPSGNHVVVCDGHLLGHLLVLLRLTHRLSILNGLLLLLDWHNHVGGIRRRLLVWIEWGSLGSSAASLVGQGLLLLPAEVEDLEAGKGAWDEDQGGEDDDDDHHGVDPVFAI